MMSFDWHDYPDLIKTQEDHTSENLHEDYLNQVAKLLKFAYQAPDQLDTEQIYGLLDQYRSLVENSEKYSFMDWPDIRLMTRAENETRPIVSAITHLLPIYCDHIYQATSDDKSLLLIVLTFSPDPMIGQKNETDVKIKYKLLSSTLAIDKVEINEETVIFHLDDDSEFKFTGLSGWKQPLGLDFKSITTLSISG